MNYNIHSLENQYLTLETTLFRVFKNYFFGLLLSLLKTDNILNNALQFKHCDFSKMIIVKILTNCKKQTVIRYLHVSPRLPLRSIVSIPTSNLPPLRTLLLFCNQLLSLSLSFVLPYATASYLVSLFGCERSLVSLYQP